ncbi:MAG: phenylalanine--tRNA ligase subunit beta [Desulfobacteraceae bacterium]|nr:phenylalanine--tRNA ligase subunit beta [Desulfobacteraceae bacterium]
MKFTFSWLTQYIDPGLTPAQVADRLTMAGLEVDSVEELFATFDNVRVAKVLGVERHPDADKLTVCRVEVGTEEKQIVCGAPNVRAGLTTAVALPGAKLPSGLVIKKAKLRGVESQGMLCSAREIGLGEEAGGIMELPDSLASGAPLAEALGLRDTVIEVDLTPNRADCASVLGIAREVGGFTGRKMASPVAETDLPVLDGTNVPFGVEVEDPVACPRYAARLLTGITIGPSPWWLRRQLLAVGVRPINNVVDVTNFVMLEYGQPLHAFDFDRLAGQRIVVRTPRPGEGIATLDGQERTLEPEMLLICDAEKPVAVAGVMGGANSEVGPATTRVLLESAFFNPVSVRRTARTLKMSTEASYRFERGVDPQGTVKALERAARLLVEIAGATPVPGGIDRKAEIPEPPLLTLRVARTNDLLGTVYTRKEIAAALNAIEIAAEEKDAGTLMVRPPSFRVDLEREVDLIEEVARLKGYNTIPTTLPLVPMRFPAQDRQRELHRELARLFVSLGFSEAINYSFVAAQHCDLLGLAADDAARAFVRLLNPLAEEQSVLRTTLLPGLLENVRHNLNHESPDIRLFEIGKSFFSRGEASLPEERLRLTAVASGRRHPGAPRLHAGEAAVDLYDLKGVVEQVLAMLRVEVRLEAEALARSYAAPGSSMRLTGNGRELGSFGRLAPEMGRGFGIKQEVYFLDLDLDGLGALAPAPKGFRSLPKFPAVKWDAAFLVPENVGGGDLIAAIREANEPLVEEAELFDVYRGKSIEAGWKSVAIAVTYRAADRTLDDRAVGKVHQRLSDMIIDRFQAKLREG